MPAQRWVWLRYSRAMSGDSPTLPAGPSQTLAYAGEPPVVDAVASTLAMAAPEPDALIGAVLAGRYRILSELGAGGMGTVYLGEHVAIGKHFAIKVLNPEFCTKSEAIERFMREAKTSSRISHPNVVKITDFGFSDAKMPFFVMEKLEGEELGDAAEREGAMAWPRVRTILTQMLAALEAAHAVGVVHRDIKPQNCFLVHLPEGGEILKVLDFGIAKVINDDPDFKTLTQTGVVVGSVHYMSPEQARSERVDVRSDIYSAGVVAYKLLTGEVPYDATGVVGVLSKLLTEDYPPMATVAPGVRVHTRVEAVVRRAMAKERDDRYASASAFAAALRELPEDLSGLAEPARGPAQVLDRGGFQPASLTSNTLAQPSPHTRVAVARLPEDRPKQGGGRRRRGWLGRLVVLGVLVGGAAAAVLYLPELRGVRERAGAVTDELTEGLTDTINKAGLRGAEDNAAQVERERYVSLVTAAASAHGVELSLDQLHAPNTFVHTIRADAPTKIAPTKSLRAGSLSLRARVEGGGQAKHTLLELHNLGSVPLAYRVELGTGKCHPPGGSRYDALVLDPGAKVKVAVCAGRRSVELVDLRQLELSVLGAALVRKLPARAVGLSGAAARAHDPGATVVQCSAELDSAAGLEQGEYAWEDVVDFFSRHDCDHYGWWPGYRRALEAIPSLPVLAPVAAAETGP